MTIAACLAAGAAVAAIGNGRAVEARDGYVTHVWLFESDHGRPLAGQAGISTDARFVGTALIATEMRRSGWPLRGEPVPCLFVELRFGEPGHGGTRTDTELAVDDPWRRAVRRSFLGLAPPPGIERDDQPDGAFVTAAFVAAARQEELTGERSRPGNFVVNWIVITLALLAFVNFARGAARAVHQRRFLTTPTPRLMAES
jgi:hypothetical protein